MTQQITDQLLSLSESLKTDYSSRVQHDILSIDPLLLDALQAYHQLPRPHTRHQSKALTAFVQALSLYSPESSYIKVISD